jgi:hypothetical protein
MPVGARSSRSYDLTEPCANKKTFAIKALIGASLGTHRFQRAVSAEGASRNNVPPNRDCTLEAMRTQVSSWFTHGLR